MVKKINSKTIIKIFPIIGIILLAYIIYNIGAEKITTTFISIPIEYYVLALLLFIPRILLYVYQWQLICKKQKMDFSFLYLFKVSIICLFYGSVTPGSLGWHLRIYYLKEKTKYTWEKCIANSLLDGTIGSISGIFLALIGSLILIEYVPGLFTILLLLLIFYVVTFVVFMKKKRGNRLFNIFIRLLIPEKFKGIIGQSIESLYEDLPRLRDVVVPFLLEIIIWILAAIQVYIIALAFSIDVPFVSFISISIVSAVVATSLPISVGGLGIREGMFVFLLSAFGVEPQIAFVISLSGYLVKTLLPGLVGWFFTFRKTEEMMRVN